MTDLIFKTDGEETFRIPFPTPGTKCPEMKLEIKMTEPTDEQLDELWDEIGGYYNLYPEVRNTIREALNRWGNVEDDEQLIEEYSKEIFGSLYTPECKISVERLIEHSRKLREINGDLTKVRAEAHKEGFDSGMRMAERHKVSIETLKLLTIQQIANLIGTDD